MGTKVGVIGLGNMGGAMAVNLLKAGFDVIGLDLDAAKLASFESAGGTVADSPSAISHEADIIILSLPNVEALESVLHGAGGLAVEGKAGVVCVESGTFPLSAKFAAAEALTSRGIHLLDCTVSGTGSQAKDRDIVLYASGPEDHVQACASVFDAISKAAPRVGDFGAGSIMKFVSNLLVAVHTVAAAEALTLAAKCGLDPESTLKLISAGAGQSRMLEVRGPLMAAREYDIGSASVDTLAKDTEIILEFAGDHNSPVPLLSIAGTFLRSAAANGLNELDPAVVREVFGSLAGLDAMGSGARSS